MMSNPVGWFEIYVQDMARATAFYEAMLQQRLDNLPSPDTEEFPDLEMQVFPMSNEEYGATGALVKMADMPSGGNSTLVYFSCEDCAVEAARAAENGGRIFKEKMSIGEHGFIALVYDTEGNMIGLHSMV
ncbi:MAG: VOC family protein [Candidatus Competibacteraceae bacterium]